MPNSSADAPIYDWNDFSFDTRQVHAGEYPDHNAGLRIPPIALSAGYVFADFDDQVERFASAPARAAGFAGTTPFVGDAELTPAPIYSRQGNPTNAVAEARLASLEGGSAAIAVSSGQAAITAALFTLAQHGDHIVSTASIYGGTRILFARSFKRFGIAVDYVWDEHDDAEWERQIGPHTKAIYTETIPNPRNDITDLRQIAAVARRHNLPLVVDNTVGTPALIRPLELGANIVVHSTTKFLTGHGAAVGGAIVDGGNFDWPAAVAAGRKYPLITERIRAGLGSMSERFGTQAFARACREAVVNDIGPSLSPLHGFLLHQGMETLSLRMARHVRSSLTIAQWLSTHPLVKSVDYAGLAGSDRYALALRDYGAADQFGELAAGGGSASSAPHQQCLGARTGSVFGVSLHGGLAAAREFVNGLRVFSRMTGIGDTRSMVLHPLSSTHASFKPEINQRLGITPELLRLSVGLEAQEDLLADLERALQRVGDSKNL